MPDPLITLVDMTLTPEERATLRARLEYAVNVHYGCSKDTLERTALRLLDAYEDREKQQPICPYCRSVMTVTIHEGYYDTYPYWECECDYEELKERATSTRKGAYTS